MNVFKKCYVYLQCYIFLQAATKSSIAVVFVGSAVDWDKCKEGILKSKPGAIFADAAVVYAWMKFLIMIQQPSYVGLKFHEPPKEVTDEINNLHVTFLNENFHLGDDPSTIELERASMSDVAAVRHPHAVADVAGGVKCSDPSSSVDASSVDDFAASGVDDFPSSGVSCGNNLSCSDDMADGVVVDAVACPVSLSLEHVLVQSRNFATQFSESQIACLALNSLASKMHNSESMYNEISSRVRYYLIGHVTISLMCILHCFVVQTSNRFQICSLRSLLLCLCRIVLLMQTLTVFLAH